MSEPRDDVPSDLAPYFEAEARRAPLSAERRAAVLARVGQSLGVALGPTGGGSGGGSSVPEAPIRNGAGAILRLATRPIVAATLAFVVGGAVGAAVHASASSRPPSAAVRALPTIVVVVPRAESPSRPSASVSDDPVAASSAAPSVSGHAARAESSAPPLGPLESLAAERALLESARAAMQAHDFARASRDLRDHEARFPKGQLAEEREALRVQMLYLSGKAAEGEASAEKFRLQFPESVHGTAIDAAKKNATP